MKSTQEQRRRTKSLSHQLRASRTISGLAAATLDALLVICGYAVALELRFDASIPANYADQFRHVLAGLIAIHLLANAGFRVYSRVWRYASLPDALALAWAGAIATGMVFVANTALFPLNHPLPLTVVPVAGLLTMIAMALVRFRHRVYETLLVAFTRPPRSRLLIVGAGQAGQRLARELLSTPSLGYEPVCFLDDDPEKLGRRIHGLPVAGPCLDVGRAVAQHKVGVIVFAIPSLLGEPRRQILSRCESSPARVKILPGLPELLTPDSREPLFRDARLEDLLARPVVAFPNGERDEGIHRGVLITGAAGSIGAELARQVSESGCSRLVLLDFDESGLFELSEELVASGYPPPTLVVADIARVDRITGVFKKTSPAVVFHAAAYKHVPLLEAHPFEAVRTNVLGTLAVFEAAEAAGCERVVFVSSDKAVAPANVMGATKRVGELLVESFAGGETVFCAVRFGNVLGSRGSVVPTFLRQIRQGGPVTITDPNMTRYFMTIPEAANLILAASSQARGGEIFILDMGEPVLIIELARKMIRLHGMQPDQDIEIRVVGVRAGEKLHEALTGPDEALAATKHPRVSRVASSARRKAPRTELAAKIQQLARLAEGPSTEPLLRYLYELAGSDAAATQEAPVEPGEASLETPVRLAD